MANVQHKDIVDPNIHEPKGVAFAQAGHAYIANGLGSGSWQEVLVPASLGIIPSAVYSFNHKITSSMANGVLFPIATWTLSSNWGDIRVTPTTGFLEVSRTGIYLVNIDFSVTVDGDGVYTIANPTKTKSSLTAFQSVMTSEVRGENVSGYDGGLVGYFNQQGIIVRLEAGQGFGFWCTGKRGSKTNGIDDTRIQGWIQMTRLGDA